MKRLQIDYCPEFPTKELVLGIYYMAFGDGMFYIGRSINIRQRAKQHKQELEKLLKLYGDNPKLIPDYHYLKNVFSELVATGSPVLFISLIEECTPENIMQCEQKWLDEALLFPNCANLGFESKPSSHDVRMANFLKAKP